LDPSGRHEGVTVPDSLGSLSDDGLPVEFAPSSTGEAAIDVVAVLEAYDKAWDAFKVERVGGKGDFSLFLEASLHFWTLFQGYCPPTGTQELREWEDKIPSKWLSHL